MNNFKPAIKDLNHALNLDPNHKNAQKYLERLTQIEEKKQQKELEMQKSLINGEFILPIQTEPVSQKKRKLI
jgi:hypothetical protein